MARVSFESWKQASEFHNPLKNNDLDRPDITIRVDPLTGHQSILAEALAGKIAILFPETDYDYLRTRFEETGAQCFMCDGRWRQATPRYPERLIPGGRIERGEVVLFPNLFPVAAYHAVVKVGEKHGRMLNDFPASLLFDAFSVSLEFIRRCFADDPATPYFSINLNFMPPAGASIVHPHVQVVGSSVPPTHHRRLLERGLSYFRENGSCYWLDLLQTEKESGKRWVGEIGPTRWFTAYSPQGVNEVNAVWPNVSNFLEWTEDDVRAMAEGVRRTLLLYHEMKHSTFNLTCFSGHLGKTTPEFRCLLSLINRQNMNLHYRTDDYFVQKMLQNEIIINSPESLASRLRAQF